jgi:hypothetical protein
MIPEVMSLHRKVQAELSRTEDFGDIGMKDFVEETMRDYMEPEPNRYVRLGDMHDEWFDAVEENRRVGIICARGHLKTSFALAYLAYRMMKTPNFRAIYFAATLDQAYDKLEQFEEYCRRSYRLNPMISGTSDIYGWRRSAKYFKNGSRVQAGSVGKSLEGKHVSLVLCDDVLQEFPSYPDERVIFYVQRVVMPIMLPQGQLMVIGTQKRVGDLADYVRESDDWATVWHPAILKDGEPRWPEYWTSERLENEKQAMGSRAFESEYMLNPIDPETAVIPWSLIKMALNEDIDMALPAPDGWDVVMGVDLAVGMDVRNDETSYVVLAFERDTGRRRVLYSWTGRVHSEGAGWLRDQVLNLRKLAERWKPSVIMVESNGYQRLVVHAADDWGRLPVKGHNTGSEKHSASAGVPSIAVKMEQGKYEIPWHPDVRKERKGGSMAIVNGMKELMWGKGGRLEGHTPDTIMALWMAEIAIQKKERDTITGVRWDFL